MQQLRTFAATSEEELWQQVAADMAREDDLLDYSATLEQGGHITTLDIDIDLGGGFEGGSALTVFRAPFTNNEAFVFGLHHESFIDEIGKFFGMQDIQIGDPNFDANVVIKSNDEYKVRSLLADPVLQRDLIEMRNFVLEINSVDESDPIRTVAQLELTFDEGITDPTVLRKHYSTFYRVLERLVSNSGT